MLKLFLPIDMFYLIYFSKHLDYINNEHVHFKIKNKQNKHQTLNVNSPDLCDVTYIFETENCLNNVNPFYFILDHDISNDLILNTWY